MKSGYVTYTGPVGKTGYVSFCWLYRNAWLWGVGWGWGKEGVLLSTEIWGSYSCSIPWWKQILTPNFYPISSPSFMQFVINIAYVASVCARVIARKLEWRRGRGKGKRKNLFLSWSPSPFIPPFCSRPTFVEEHARKRLLRRLFSARARFPVGKTLSYAETFCLPNKTGHDS